MSSCLLALVSLAYHGICGIHSYCHVQLLPSPSWCCLPHDSPTSRETGLGARNSDLIQKASRQRRWWTNVPKTHLAWLWMLVSFTEQGGRGSVFSGLPTRAFRNVYNFLVNSWCLFFQHFFLLWSATTEPVSMVSFPWTVEFSSDFKLLICSTTLVL